MGGKASKSSKALSHKDLSREIVPYFANLPEMDQNLYQFAIKQVTKESKKLKLKSVEVCLNFSNNMTVNVKSDDNPQNCYVVTHDGSGGFHACWEMESPARYVFRMLSKSLDDFFTWLGDVTKAAAHGLGGTARPALTGGN
ncbi:uncharacterized protein LOC128553280 [Mercenaria mercenaria]|uniref:uncharacterized protein LOC128553280 n=1 Tax=Mercenaria mercenaria TaxID=6596 RepID=UPI00234F7901|nr:uncharacterized protein LOC128553280 [Mercenaria mercenaria]